MTEEITPKNGHPSRSDLEIAKLRERHNALKDDVGDMRSAVVRIEGLMVSHIHSSSERHAQLLATFNQHNLDDTIVHQRVLQIDTHLTATDKRLEDAMKREEEKKRDPVSFWTSIAAAGTAVGAILTAIFGGKP